MFNMRQIIVYLSLFIIVLAVVSGQEQQKTDFERCLKERRKPWYHCLSRIDWRRANFPIRPPRLRPPTTNDVLPYIIQSKEEPLTPPSDILSVSESQMKRSNVPGSTNRRQYIVQSPSESRQFLAWIKVPVRRERLTAAVSPVYGRISSQNSRSMTAPTSTTTTAKPMPKLLLPTPKRPAMYSLNGFVPKPSIVHIKKATISDAKDKHPYPLQLRQLDVAASNRVSVRLDLTNAVPKRQVPFTSKTKSHYRTPKVGIPGIDYPTYSSIPDTEFRCPAEFTPRMYADTETGCQVWHICAGSGGPKYSFICPNKSIFNEVKQTCDWWYRVECRRTKKLRRRFGREM